MLQIIRKAQLIIAYCGELCWAQLAGLLQGIACGYTEFPRSTVNARPKQ